jgi:hypothetical protein
MCRQGSDLAGYAECPDTERVTMFNRIAQCNRIRQNDRGKVFEATAGLER